MPGPCLSAVPDSKTIIQKRRRSRAESLRWLQHRGWGKWRVSMNQRFTSCCGLRSFLQRERRHQLPKNLRRKLPSQSPRVAQKCLCFLFQKIRHQFTPFVLKLLRPENYLGPFKLPKCGYLTQRLSTQAGKLVRMTSVPFQNPKGATKPEGRSPGTCILKKKGKKERFLVESDLEFLITLQTARRVEKPWL